ncbi:MAG: P-II family nitrogen regulator [Spirochaetes bacterium]|nr:P-II family nitrogen regulator [Spirochaetota bacterium]
MKLITAIIQEDKLDDVREALIQADITRITVSRVAGHGRQDDIDIYRGQQIAPSLIAKIEMKIACNDEFVNIAVDTILKTARHGEGTIGDGKIWITPIEECIRIRTGEKGGSAI